VKVSVICATLGPLSEVDLLIKSVIHSLQRADSDISAEFILVDQSEEAMDCCFQTSDRLDLIHIRNLKKGLSLNRNIGLDRASGDWLMLIDSDCLISEDYFKNFVELERANPAIDHFVGRILDPYYYEPLFRRWPCTSRRLWKPMLWYYATSVNSIFRAGDARQRFDERFGLGAVYGSCEDLDFFLRLKTRRLYTPKLSTLHPDIFQVKLPRKKFDSYSYGFGALCAKHLFPLGLIMMVASLLKKAADVARGRSTAVDLARATAFRVRGFFAYLGKRI
jgi:glycosyltransferase involved in cell wall biosynthesis